MSEDIIKKTKAEQWINLRSHVHSCYAEVCVNPGGLNEFQRIENIKRHLEIVICNIKALDKTFEL